MSIAELQKRWEAHAATHPIRAAMIFADGFLVVGAGTRLGKVGVPDEMRLASRLAAAHRRPIAAMPLRHFKRAFDAMREGDAALAYTHLALSGRASSPIPMKTHVGSSSSTRCWRQAPTL